MMRPGRKASLILLLAAALYLYVTAVFRTSPEEFTLVRDRETGESTVLGPGFSFVWQGAVPGRIEISRYPLRAPEFIEARVAIPPLGDLEGDHYAVKLPLSVIYEVVPGVFKAAQGFDRREARPGAARIKELADKAFSTVLGPYAERAYDRIGIMRDRERITSAAYELVKSRAAKVGLSVISMELAGPMVLPEQGVYQEGIAFLADLREIERRNRKEYLALESELDREKRRKKEYLEKLSDVSRLVKSNPDLLKYIYIDRLGGDVKVILAPEKSGMPLGLSLDDGKTVEKRKGEIDNLR